MESLQQMMNGSRPYEMLPLQSGGFLKDSCAYLISSLLLNVKHEDKKNVLSLNFPWENLLLITRTLEPPLQSFCPWAKQMRRPQIRSIKDFQKMRGRTGLKPALCRAFNFNDYLNMSIACFSLV